MSLSLCGEGGRRKFFVLFFIFFEMTQFSETGLERMIHRLVTNEGSAPRETERE